MFVVIYNCIVMNKTCVYITDFIKPKLLKVTDELVTNFTRIFVFTNISQKHSAAINHTPQKAAMKTQ